ncbi:hypothetical protein G3O08_07215 [Cryomorpha ignava]|uniref:DsrE family protein n=1 Tax=Cryomorpha ignava TaxID=101383 RepID=A0A7K3WNZ2_9FLAO|nr:DsrE family protein [Cryomorpha ignava]NEN23286.1 hypothetical protein [Cryomorpha ignava]
MKSYTAKLSLLAVVTIIISLFSTSMEAQDTGENHKIVFQLTDNDVKSQKALTNQLKNLTESWPNAQIQVVVHSAGIHYLMKEKSGFKSEIEALVKKGVEFKACENTLKSKEIDKLEILEVAGFVPMGIGEVVLKQEAGWSYIKAGF